MPYKNTWCPETQAISGLEAAQALVINAKTSEESDAIYCEELNKLIDEFMMSSERLINKYKEKV